MYLSIHLQRYAECYPGLAEMDDAMGDSDDEVLVLLIVMFIIKQKKWCENGLCLT